MPRIPKPVVMRDFVPDPTEIWLWRILSETQSHEHVLSADGALGRFVRLFCPIPIPWVVERVERINGKGSAIEAPFWSAYLMGKVGEALAFEPHFVTVNIFRSTEDFMEHHQDGPALFGPTFATLSFGAPREICIRGLETPLSPKRQPLQHMFEVGSGDLYILDEHHQRDFTHGVAAGKGIRVSLTFGTVLPEPAEDSWSVFSLLPMRTLRWGCEDDVREYAEKLAAKEHLCAIADPEQKLHFVGDEQFQMQCRIETRKVTI